jgi:hypothetical protein
MFGSEGTLVIEWSLLLTFCYCLDQLFARSGVVLLLNVWCKAPTELYTGTGCASVAWQI